MIAALFAVDEKGGMGNQGNMPWPMIKEDMKWFKRATEGHVVAMGKTSWNSPDMPKPLPKRHNVVFTSNFMDRDDVLQIKGDVCTGLKHVQEENPNLNIFVIGGPNVLAQARPVITHAYITRIPGEYICDTTINLDEFLEGFVLKEILDLGTCKVEQYETV